jgi:hypothetical protein
MPRRILGALLIPILAGTCAQAQVNFPGSTPEGDYLRGVGIAAQGMGSFNLQTAQANQINTETFIRWNEYVDAVIRTQVRELAAHRAARRAEYDELHARRRENPNDLDVLKGDALNDVLKQLLDPKISESAIRYAEVTLPGDVIRQIPFMLAENKARFSMSRLTMKGKGKWPVAFQDPRFASYLRTYHEALDVALEQAIDEKLTERAIADVEVAVRDLRQKLDAVFPPSNDPRYLEAKERLEELGIMVDLLKKHRVEVAIGEIDKYSGTTVNDLRLFMQRHGLQFAPATTPDEKTLYPKLHASLVEQREKLGGAVDLQPKK